VAAKLLYGYTLWTSLWYAFSLGQIFSTKKRSVELPHTLFTCHSMSQISQHLPLVMIWLAVYWLHYMVEVACLQDSWGCKIWNNFLIYPFFKLIWSDLPGITGLVHYLTAFHMAFTTTQLENNESVRCSQEYFYLQLPYSASTFQHQISIHPRLSHLYSFIFALSMHISSSQILSASTSLLNPHLSHLKHISFNIHLKL
jgi:hypothetical protein